jgi:guanosine-3',5'-bis(diphosphate) 3'-pyrophosphohydrolase
LQDDTGQDSVKALLTKTSSYLPPERNNLVVAAYEYAKSAHAGQLRLSGEPFIKHPLETARYLAGLNMDATTLAAALLHDVIEDCGVTVDEITLKFGKDVATLVDGVTKLGKLDVVRMEHQGTGAHVQDDSPNQAASLRKMLVAMARDLRVVLIKLADRLHNMSTLKALPYARRLAIAQETLDIYAPLAHRLGMWDIKWRLEDMAFHHLQPTAYRRISRLLASRREEREQYITNVSNVLSLALENAYIKAEITGRPKHIYSIYKKMEAYSAQGKDFNEIYDLFALRVLVHGNQDCYTTLGVLHALWNPLPGQFDDYIGKPKENMYQALHTILMGPEGVPLEIQIKTYEMHQISEYGVASHWRYKEGSDPDTQFEQKMTWLRQLLEWQSDVTGTDEFLENVKTDLFPDQVFVYTPKGEIKELPSGSTPIDFSYHVHTDLGHRCIGAKVNGKLVPLDYKLRNGDTVETLTSKVVRGPNLDWLNPNAGYVRSATARQRIRAWFRRQARSENIQRGRELLARELRRHNMIRSDQELTKLFKLDTTEEFLSSLGSGAITINQIATRLAQQQEEEYSPVQEEVLPAPKSAHGIKVIGMGDVLTHLGRCCSPLPGDTIIGFITRNRGVTVHKHDCHNVFNEDETERLVHVNWGATKTLHTVRLTVEAWDRVGLLRDITTLVSAEKINIASMSTHEHNDGTVTLQLTIFTTGVDQLSRLFTKLEKVQGVTTAYRFTISKSVSPRELSNYKI